MMWLIPFAMTVAAFIWAMIYGRNDAGTFGSGMLANALIWSVAAIPPLVSWLIWALLS